VHRPALSEAHLQARAWFRERIIQDGLDFRQDAAGNHSAFLACGQHNGATLMLGSHLDSVPQGGRFDGALGVLAALEVLRCVQETGLALPVNLEAIDFTDEEGTLVGLLGSRALAGRLQLEELQKPRGGRENLLAGLERAGLNESGLMAARRADGSLAGYLELHIEQGPRLLDSGADIGVVTTIVGICSYRLAFTGRADHAGTTPMDSRLDASLGAAAFTLAARRTVMESFPDCVVNVGEMSFEPGAFNIVPARANLALEFRSPEKETFNRLEIALMAAAQEETRRFGLGLEIEFLGRHQPTPMSAQAGAAIVAAADELGLKHIPLASGAGHDAQSLAELCPAGMIFVPSQGGASHSAREFSEWQDCVNGANVLLNAALKLAETI
jgi:N-carbamoyl-L-amino-acid hydrolase